MGAAFVYFGFPAKVPSGRCLGRSAAVRDPALRIVSGQPGKPPTDTSATRTAVQTAARALAEDLPGSNGRRIYRLEVPACAA